MQCLRVCSAYSYRLTRRHSTLLLLASFIVTITIILHLYAYRYQNHPHAQPRIGDFTYRPGSFLKGLQPNDNKSYCDFNYGLPDVLKWGTYQLYPSPEAGSKSPYNVIYNAIQGRDYENCKKHEAVTYATQATPEFLYHLVEVARYWDGPISLSVFVPNYDLDITIQIINHLCHCYPGMAKVSLHLFYPKKYPPMLRSLEQRVVTTEIPTTTTNTTIEEILRKKLENYRKLDNKTRAEYITWVRKKKVERMMMNRPSKITMPPNLRFNDCSGLDSLDIRTYRREFNMLYPINVGRNVARKAAKTNYFLMSDIEMVPSDGLAPKFLAMVKKLMGDKKREEGCLFSKTIFVVPLFEVERGEEIPRNKETLVRMVTANRALYFHQKVCSHCQRFPGLQSWLMRPAINAVEPMLIARREYPYHRWEPLYFGTNEEPWYSEMLTWEGRQDKMTQMLDLCLQGYEFSILDGGFLCHPKRRKHYRTPLETAIRRRAVYSNLYKYSTIILALEKKYATNKEAMTRVGCKKCDMYYGF